jgi:hypothetical protein
LLQSWAGREKHTGLLVGKLEGRKLFRRRKHRWEDNGKKDLRNVGNILSSREADGFLRRFDLLDFRLPPRCQ